MRVTDKRTQVYLTREQHAALRRLARTKKVSLAQIVREALDAYLGRPRSTGKGPDPLDGLIGFATGPDDLSANHDDYLYGRP